MELIKWLSVTDRYTHMYLDKNLSNIGLNSNLHKYVVRICEDPGVTQDQFIRFFYVHPSNITRSLAALIQSGFIRREHNPEDKRTFLLYPTSKALQVYPKIIALSKDWQEQLLSDLSPDEADTFLNLLQKIGKRAVSLLKDE